MPCSDIALLSVRPLIPWRTRIDKVILPIFFTGLIKKIDDYLYFRFILRSKIMACMPLGRKNSFLTFPVAF